MCGFDISPDAESCKTTPFAGVCRVREKWKSSRNLCSSDDRGVAIRAFSKHLTQRARGLLEG